MSAHLPAGACVAVQGDDYIAGWNKRGDWQNLRARLVLGQPDGWAEAFTDFYKQRLDLRYLNPIKVMQEHGTFNGEPAGTNADIQAPISIKLCS